MRARNRVGIELSYRPARLHRLEQLIPWNGFLGSIKVFKFGLWRASRITLFLSVPSPHRLFKNSSTRLRICIHSVIRIHFLKRNFNLDLESSCKKKITYKKCHRLFCLFTHFTLLTRCLLNFFGGLACLIPFTLQNIILTVFSVIYKNTVQFKTLESRPVYLVRIRYPVGKNFIPPVPRRLFFTALQRIAIAQGPKIQQKNEL